MRDGHPPATDLRHRVLKKRTQRSDNDPQQLVHLHIDDDGQGFPADQIDDLINRGVRADTRREGQGIGLAISNELVENYGGTITLGQSPLGGARVSISMPAAT